MDKSTIIKTLRDMAKHPTVTLPRDCEALKAAADLIEQAQKPVLTFDGMTATEFALLELYKFQEATKCDTADEFIEQAQKQGPVAWINWCAATGKRSVSFECESELASEPLYSSTTQITQDHYSKRQPLTDEEIQKMRYLIDWTAGWTYITFARAIEAAHGIKGEA